MTKKGSYIPHFQPDVMKLSPEKERKTIRQEDIKIRIPQKPRKTINNFSIFPVVNEIVSTVSKSQITIVQAETNSGKIIALPHCLAKTYPKSIFCSVPTITAARFAFKYQSESCYYADDVAYQNNAKDAKMVYCTPDYLFCYLISSGFSCCSVMILDEFQARTKDTDACLCLWINAFDLWKNDPLSNPPPPKLVIMGTAIDESIIQMLPMEPVVLAYENIPLQTKMVFDYEPFCQKMSYDHDQFYTKAVEIVYHQHKIYCTNDTMKTYLVLVPGKYELELIYDHLGKLLTGTNTEIYRYHDSLSEDEITQLYCNKQRIIIATQAIEYAIGLENVVLIVDTMVISEMEPGQDESSNLNHRLITQANVKQRMGLAKNGTYFPLIEKIKFGTLPNKIIPQIQYTSLYHQIIQLVRYKLNPVEILKPIISERQIMMQIELLDKLGCIVNEGRESWKITEMGLFCLDFPLGIRKSAILYYLKNNDDPNIFIYAAVLCTLQTYGSGIFCIQNKGAQTKKEIIDQFAGYSDADTIFNIWTKICSTMNPFYLTHIHNFCVKYCLCFRRFKEASQLLKQCITILNCTNYYPGLFIPPTADEFSHTFYHLLELTHQDYRTTVYISVSGDAMAVCGDQNHKVDNRAIHRIELGHNINQNYFTLIRSNRTTQEGRFLRIINVLHAIPNGGLVEEEDNPSIFSSDVDDSSESFEEEQIVWNYPDDPGPPIDPFDHES